MGLQERESSRDTNSASNFEFSQQLIRNLKFGHLIRRWRGK